MRIFLRSCRATGANWKTVVAIHANDMSALPVKQVKINRLSSLGSRRCRNAYSGEHTSKASAKRFAKTKQLLEKNLRGKQAPYQQQENRVIRHENYNLPMR